MKFSDIAISAKFKLNDVEYIKIDPERVSCCTILNSLNMTDNKKVMIKPDQEVELAE